MRSNRAHAARLSAPEPGASRQRVRLWVELIVAVGLALTFALLALGFLLGAAGAYHHRGASRGGQAVGALICLGLLVFCSRWAVHVEHRLRHRQPVAQTFESGGTGGLSPRALRSRRRRGYGPIGTSVRLLLFVALAVVLVDPQQPGYAELPGSMFENRWSWILLLLLGVLFAWLAIVEGRVLSRLLTHRREHQAHTRVRMTATP